MLAASPLPISISLNELIKLRFNVKQNSGFSIHNRFTLETIPVIYDRLWSPWMMMIGLEFYTSCIYCFAIFCTCVCISIVTHSLTQSLANLAVNVVCQSERSTSEQQQKQQPTKCHRCLTLYYSWQMLLKCVDLWWWGLRSSRSVE